MATVYQHLTKKAPSVMKKKREKVMDEFHSWTLRSWSTGQVITNPRQAVAIAYSEARRAKLKK